METTTVRRLLDSEIHFATKLADLAGDLHAEKDLQPTVNAVLARAPEVVGCSSAGLMLMAARQRLGSATATDGVAGQAQALQLELGDGPCWSALADNEAMISDSAAETRWPTWSPLVVKLGVRSVASVRLIVGSTTLGTLTMFDPQPGRFDANDLAATHAYARHASLAIADARQAATMREAVDARHRIGQAQGIVMERFDLDADQAFALLRRYSQNSNIKLRDIAAHLIATRELPEDMRPVTI